MRLSFSQSANAPVVVCYRRHVSRNGAHVVCCLRVERLGHLCARQGRGSVGGEAAGACTRFDISGGLLTIFLL